MPAVQFMELHQHILQRLSVSFSTEEVIQFAAMLESVGGMGDGSLLTPAPDQPRAHVFCGSEDAHQLDEAPVPVARLQQGALSATL